MCRRRCQIPPHLLLCNALPERNAPPRHKTNIDETPQQRHRQKIRRIPMPARDDPRRNGADNQKYYNAAGQNIPFFSAPSQNHLPKWVSVCKAYHTEEPIARRAGFRAKMETHASSRLEAAVAVLSAYCALDKPSSTSTGQDAAMFRRNTATSRIAGAAQKPFLCSKTHAGSVFSLPLQPGKGGFGSRYKSGDAFQQTKPKLSKRRRGKRLPQFRHWHPSEAQRPARRRGLAGSL